MLTEAQNSRLVALEEKFRKLVTLTPGTFEWIAAANETLTDYLMDEINRLRDLDRGMAGLVD